MFRVESQASICEWCEATFGPVSSNARVAARANEEMAELLEKLADNAKNEDAVVEVADVVIVLARLATRLGLDAAAVSPCWVGACPFRASGRANKDMASLLRALTVADAPSDQAREKLASLLGSLQGLAQALGANLGEEVDRKMAVNRARAWALDGSGHGYHVRMETSS